MKRMNETKKRMKRIVAGAAAAVLVAVKVGIAGRNAAASSRQQRVDYVPRVNVTAVWTAVTAA